MGNDTIPTARLEEIRELAAKATHVEELFVLANEIDPGIVICLDGVGASWTAELFEFINPPHSHRADDATPLAAMRLCVLALAQFKAKLIERRNKDEA
jgi:hypothetical protein